MSYVEGLRNVKKSGIVAAVKLYQKGRQKEDFEKGIGDDDKRKSTAKEMCHVEGLILRGVCACNYGIGETFDIWKWPKRKEKNVNNETRTSFAKFFS